MTTREEAWDQTERMITSNRTEHNRMIAKAERLERAGTEAGCLKGLYIRLLDQRRRVLGAWAVLHNTAEEMHSPAKKLAMEHDAGQFRQQIQEVDAQILDVAGDLAKHGIKIRATKRMTDFAKEFNP